MTETPTTLLPPELRRTSLNETHRRHKAKMVDFGGWDMPVQYDGLIAEHMAVRTGVGLFDVSHMGDIQLRGPNSLAAVQKLLMNDATKLAIGQAHYSAMLTPEGTFVDDVVLHKLGENDYLIVINAGTREKDVQWVRKVIGSMSGVHIMDVSDYYTQLAIQGPMAKATLQKLTGVDLTPIKNYWFTWGQVCGCHNVMIARTGYTGEDGFEIYIPSDEPTSSRVWGEVLAAGAEFGILPCGLGSRNTLRLEAAMALYGHEISDTINVFEAGLGRYCKLDKGTDFVGSDALKKIQDGGGADGPAIGRKLVGLEMLDRGIGRRCRTEQDRPRHQRLACTVPEEEHRARLRSARVRCRRHGSGRRGARRAGACGRRSHTVLQARENNHASDYGTAKLDTFQTPQSSTISKWRNLMAYPDKYKYTKEHEWIEVDGETGIVGITDYAQSSLGDIVFVELPKVGQKIEAGSTFGSVESVKAVSDLYAPVTGTVTEINEALNDAPDTINTAANDTWILKLTLTNTDEVNGLLSAADYDKFVSEETGH
jgi:aminomethyltransferase